MGCCPMNKAMLKFKARDAAGPRRPTLMKTKGWIMGKLYVTAMAAVACGVMLAPVAASADVGWTDISSDIAAREADWTPAASGDSGGYGVGMFGAVEDPAEFVSGGRVFDSFFWHEAFSAFVGVSPKHFPGCVISFR